MSSTVGAPAVGWVPGHAQACCIRCISCCDLPQSPRHRNSFTCVLPLQDEAFQLWRTEWASLYSETSVSAKLIQVLARIVLF